MNATETKMKTTSPIKKLSDREKSSRERIIISYSLRKYDDLKVLKILSNDHEIKINENLKLKKSNLCKYLIQKGLEDLDKKYGQIHEILKKENMIED